MKALIWIGGLALLASFGGSDSLSCDEGEIEHVVFRMDEGRRLVQGGKRCAARTNDAIRFVRDRDGKIVRERF